MACMQGGTVDTVCADFFSTTGRRCGAVTRYGKQATTCVHRDTRGQVATRTAAMKLGGAKATLGKEARRRSGNRDKRPKHSSRAKFRVLHYL